jgi:hypothetical protein
LRKVRDIHDINTAGLQPRYSTWCGVVFDPGDTETITGDRNGVGDAALLNRHYPNQFQL